MVTRLRLIAALGAIVTAVVLVAQIAPPTTGSPAVELRSTDAAMPSDDKPVTNLTDPDPFDPCRDIPVEVT